MSQIKTVQWAFQLLILQELSKMTKIQSLSCLISNINNPLLIKFPLKARTAYLLLPTLRAIIQFKLPKT